MVYDSFVDNEERHRECTKRMDLSHPLESHIKCLLRLWALRKKEREKVGGKEGGGEEREREREREKEREFKHPLVHIYALQGNLRPPYHDTIIHVCG